MQRGLRRGGEPPGGRPRRDQAHLQDIYEPAALEAHAARLAAARATARMVQEPEAEAVERPARHRRRSGDVVNEPGRREPVFHGVIAEATGVPRLHKMIDQVMVIPKRYRA